MAFDQRARFVAAFYVRRDPGLGREDATLQCLQIVANVRDLSVEGFQAGSKCGKLRLLLQDFGLVSRTLVIIAGELAADLVAIANELAVILVREVGIKYTQVPLQGL